MKTINIKYLLVPIVVFILSQAARSQDCVYYHEYFCKFPNSSYFYSGQSRSALFAYGMTSEFKLVTFGGEDYSISLCFQHKLKNIHFRLLEDNADRTVLFDNAESSFATSMTFSNNVARKVILEVSVPEDPTGKDKDNLHCVGVLIHFRKSHQEPQNKIGF